MSDTNPQLTELNLENELNTQIRSKTGVEIRSFDCESGGATGDIVPCDALFVDGEVQPIDVEIVVVEPEPKILIETSDG